MMQCVKEDQDDLADNQVTESEKTGFLEKNRKKYEDGDNERMVILLLLLLSRF